MSRASSGGWAATGWSPCRTFRWITSANSPQVIRAARSYPAATDLRTGSEERWWQAEAESTPANLWADFKFHCFPTGGWLALTLAAFAGFGAWRQRAPGTGGGLALAGC